VDAKRPAHPLYSSDQTVTIPAPSRLLAAPTGGVSELWGFVAHEALFFGGGNQFAVDSVIGHCPTPGASSTLRRRRAAANQTMRPCGSGLCPRRGRPCHTHSRQISQRTLSQPRGIRNEATTACACSMQCKVTPSKLRSGASHNSFAVS